MMKIDSEKRGGQAYSSPEICEMPVKIETAICGSADKESSVETWEEETFVW